MKNANEIQALLLEILRIGLLRIRALGLEGFGEQCSVEADHLHNLPELVQSLRPELLRYYYDIERPAFLRNSKSNADDFKHAWGVLGKLIAEAGRPEGQER